MPRLTIIAGPNGSGKSTVTKTVAFEGRSRVGLFREGKSRGYVVDLLFVGVESPERCVKRVRNRVALGGHFVPEIDVRRRYARSIANAAEALGLADTAKFFDNSGTGHRLVLKASAGVVVWRAEPLPNWVKL